jgi:release factor glutamine methyltransferase
MTPRARREPPLPSDDPMVVRLRASGSVYAEHEAALITAAADSPADREALVALRASGVPLAYVLGWTEFRGLRVEVDPGVFVPRPRTELVVDLALSLLPTTAAPLVVDLCCGSGAVGAALLDAWPDIELVAVDVDPRAVACAQRNLPDATVVCGDLVAPLPIGLRGRIDVLTANAPYVPSGELTLVPRDLREHEPRHTLDGGPDGVGLHRRVAAAAASWLSDGGHLVLETSERLATQSLAAAVDAGLVARLERSDDDEAVAVVGRRPRR